MHGHHLQHHILQRGAARSYKGGRDTLAVCIAVSVHHKAELIHPSFVCPILAANPEFGIHHAKLRSWTYTPLTNHDEAQKWAEETVVMLDEVVDPSSFIQRMNVTRLPYTLSDGSAQQLRVYLFRPSSLVNVFALFFHGPHYMLDAKPNMQAFAVAAANNYPFSAAMSVVLAVATFILSFGFLKLTQRRTEGVS